MPEMTNYNVSSFAHLLTEFEIRMKVEVQLFLSFLYLFTSNHLENLRRERKEDNGESRVWLRGNGRRRSEFKASLVYAVLGLGLHSVT